MNAAYDKKTLSKFFQDYDPDILCINETKTDLEKISKKKFHNEIPDGYEQHWFCS